MKRFCSYGPINTNLHYYTPREELINNSYHRLLGGNLSEGGHYITIWAPRQTGKSWIMLQVLDRLKKNRLSYPDSDTPIDVVKVDLDLPIQDYDLNKAVASIAEEIFMELGKKNPGIDTIEKFPELFTRNTLDNPLILIIDEFDALPKDSINILTRLFRNIFMRRQKELNKPIKERRYMLHGLALIGVRSVLGIENTEGSPFNVQRSFHIPNLTYNEVHEMFQCYEKESGQKIETEVIEKLYKETRGQPGLTSWLGELLTEGVEHFPNDVSKPIGLTEFENIYRLAINVLPNNNILNIISKAETEPYNKTVISLFKTDKPVNFRFDNKEINYLYMNGIIEPDIIPGNDSHVRFASPFVQKRLFNYFSGSIFNEMGQLVESFLQVKEFISPGHIDIPGIINLYQTYLTKNKTWLFKDAPRRSDMRLYEAIFHFNLYAYLDELLRGKKVRIFPEFPTGNGKIDLLIQYDTLTYGIELKSFTDLAGYRIAIEQAAQYGTQLGLRDIYMVSFIESIDDTNKKKYETPFHDPKLNITVHPIFIQTGSP